MGDAQGARELYLDVAGDRDLSRKLREKARSFADALGEDLASSDFTRLVPRDTIFYAELSRPGEQLSMLLDQLGLLGKVGQTPGRFGVSPLLIDGLLGMRGAAVAVTEFDPERGQPSGVLILHPGDLDIVRGLIETALPIAAQSADPIGGHPTWSIEGEAFVTLTSRLLVASPDRIAQVRHNRVIEQAHGHLEDYVDRDAIAAEIAQTRQLCARHGWPIIDVTRRSIEETAAAIIRLYHDREAPALEA